MQGYFDFQINGESQRVEGELANATLLDFLRRRGFTAAKSGCSDGGCGACTVVLIDLDGEGEPAFRAVNACLLRLPMLAGREIWTLEGLANLPGLHPVQEQLVANGATQCGFCAPGMVMSLFEGYYRDDIETLDDVNGQLVGNLCRCTGYRPIRDAAIKAMREGALRRESVTGSDAVSRKLPVGGDDRIQDGFGFTEVLERGGRSIEGGGGLAYMDREQGRFSQPETVTELLRLIHQFPDARLLSGGTSSPPMMEDGTSGAEFLIGIGSVAELKVVLDHGDRWEIGASVTMTALGEVVGGEFPEMSKLLRTFGGRQLRNVATVGGNLVSGAHNGDLAPMLMALDAQVRLVSLDGERDLSIGEFFVGYRQTALKDNEILKSVLLPKVASRLIGTRVADFYKVSKRGSMDRSVANAGYCVWLDQDGVIVEARLAYGGIGAFAMRAFEAERYLKGKQWKRATIEGALEKVRDAFDPVDDLLASAVYQKSLVANLLMKFFVEHSGERGERTIKHDLASQYVSRRIVGSPEAEPEAEPEADSTEMLVFVPRPADETKKEEEVMEAVPLMKKQDSPAIDGPPSPNDELEGEAPKRQWKPSGDRRGPRRNVRRKPSKRNKKK